MNDANDIVLCPFEPKHEEGVNRLFQEAYGVSYPYKVSPNIPRGAYYFVAVLAALGRVIGFARSRWLEAENRPLAYPYVHELGGYVVGEAYRRRGIGEKLSLMCEEAAHADRGEIHISHSEPVSWGNGLASQKIFQRHGFRVLGLSALKYPDISAEWHGEQPASMTIVARRTGADSDFVQYPRYLPSDYERFVQQAMHGCSEACGPSLLRHPMPEVISHHPVEAKGMLGAEIIDIPANWPDALRIIQELGKAGCLFSAFLPEHGAINVSATDQSRFDYLRLYRPPASCHRVCDWSLIQVLPCAENAKRFLIEEYTRRYR